MACERIILGARPLLVQHTVYSSWGAIRARQVHSYVKTCVATGGGIVKLAQNWGKLQTGIVVWLDMEVSTKNVEARVKRREKAGATLPETFDTAGRT